MLRKHLVQNKYSQWNKQLYCIESYPVSSYHTLLYHSLLCQIILNYIVSSIHPLIHVLYPLLCIIFHMMYLTIAGCLYVFLTSRFLLRLTPVFLKLKAIIALRLNNSITNVLCTSSLGKVSVSNWYYPLLVT